MNRQDSLCTCTCVHTSARVGHTWEGGRSCCPWEPGILGAVTHPSSPDPKGQLEATGGLLTLFPRLPEGTGGLLSGTLATPTPEPKGGAPRGHLGREASRSPGPPGLQQRQ